MVLKEFVGPHYVPADDELCEMSADGKIMWGRDIPKRKKWNRQVDNVIRAVLDVVPLESLR